MQEYDLNNPALKDRRRELRRNQTPAEKIIWKRVRGRRLGGYRFVRQYSVGPYILDLLLFRYYHESSICKAFGFDEIDHLSLELNLP